MYSFAVDVNFQHLSILQEFNLAEDFNRMSQTRDYLGKSANISQHWRKIEVVHCWFYMSTKYKVMIY